MLIVVVKTRDVLLLSLLLSAWSAAAQGSRLNVSTFLANFSPNIGLLDDSVEYHVVVFSEPQTITDFVQNLNYDEVGEWSMSTSGQRPPMTSDSCARRTPPPPSQDNSLQ